MSVFVKDVYEMFGEYGLMRVESVLNASVDSEPYVLYLFSQRVGEDLELSSLIDRDVFRVLSAEDLATEGAYDQDNRPIPVESYAMLVITPAIKQ